MGLLDTRLSDFGEEQNGVINTIQSAAVAGGLLVLLPLCQRFLKLKWLITISCVGGTVATFMSAMLTWKAIIHWPGVQVRHSQRAAPAGNFTAAPLQLHLLSRWLSLRRGRGRVD